MKITFLIVIASILTFFHTFHLHAGFILRGVTIKPQAQSESAFLFNEDGS